jgi:hypothetical protein
MKDLDFSKDIEFPNGFLSWAETHHEVVAIVTRLMEKEEYPVFLENLEDQSGMGGIWEFCIEFSFWFENKYKGKEWGDIDWFDALDLELFLKFEE